MIFIATVNHLIRPLFALITKAEGWDLELDRKKQVFIRCFIAGFLNNCVFVLIVTEIFGDTPYLMWSSKSLVSFTDVKARFKTKEDYMAA